MKSAKKQSVENSLYLRVMTAKAKITARAEETAREFVEEFPGSTTDFTAYFTAEAEAKEQRKTEKENITDHAPEWMKGFRWTTGDRRKIAKIRAYGMNRVIWADGYSKDRHADEENRPYNKDPRPMWTTADRRKA